MIYKSETYIEDSRPQLVNSSTDYSAGCGQKNDEDLRGLWARMTQDIDCFNQREGSKLLQLLKNMKAILSLTLSRS